jgi:hypothetical protein
VAVSWRRRGSSDASHAVLHPAFATYISEMRSEVDAELPHHSEETDVSGHSQHRDLRTVWNHTDWARRHQGTGLILNNKTDGRDGTQAGSRALRMLIII